MSEERRPRTTLARRLVPVAIGLAAAWIFGELFLPRPVELFVRVPAGAPEFRSLDVRVVRAEDGAQVLRVKRPHEAGARTVVVPAKLGKGRYRLEAWPSLEPAPRWEGTLEVTGEDAADVELAPAK